MTSLKLFYDGNHFTPKQTEHKFIRPHVLYLIIKLYISYLEMWKKIKSKHISWYNNLLEEKKCLGGMQALNVLASKDEFDICIFSKKTKLSPS
jgi:hypothetical protein